MSKSKKEDQAIVPKATDIVQPDPNDEDSQAHIKAEAKKGQPVYVPNVIGPNPVTHVLDSEK